ncbi:MAG TPA: acylphosphatase [Chitinophagaceae bacterium]|nr:acylphosphatase [Chitinophagaceae bacterium]
MKTIRLTIKGKVQGVFYRATAKDFADDLGIKGWIKNLPDRNVEIRATGSEELLQKFIDFCKQGPPRARVDEVIVEELELQEFNDFRIIR